MPKPDAPTRYIKSNLPTKTCAACGRPFAWRKAWAKVWDEVRYCSERGRHARNLETSDRSS